MKCKLINLNVYGLLYETVPNHTFLFQYIILMRPHEVAEKQCQHAVHHVLGFPICDCILETNLKDKDTQIHFLPVDGNHTHGLSSNTKF